MQQKVGLVLSGGGAKGAYHVGVMQAIQEFGIPIHQISGASIGALNGAVLASAPNLQIGINRLQEIWHVLPESDPIQFKYGMSIDQSTKTKLGYFGFLLSAGLKLSQPLIWLTSLVPTFLVPTLSLDNLLKDDVLESMLQDYLDLTRLQSSIPLYVSIFQQHQSNSAVQDFIFALPDGLKNVFLGIDNQFAEFRHIQSLPIQQQKQVILASCALPLLFKAYEDEQGRRFTDGGQGGLLKSQGNTPIQPLIDAGCRNIIVVHLDGASLWHRHDYSDASIIEIRPSKDLGGFKQMLDFSSDTINNLIDLGYQDTKTTLDKLQQAFSGLYDLRSSTQRLQQVFNDNASKGLDTAMQNLRKKLWKPLHEK
ncbi:patatin-like phospholipase family protein, partial [Moraxella atlantae]